MPYIIEQVSPTTPRVRMSKFRGQNPIKDKLNLLKFFGQAWKGETIRTAGGEPMLQGVGEVSPEVQKSVFDFARRVQAQHQEIIDTRVDRFYEELRSFPERTQWQQETLDLLDQLYQRFTTNALGLLGLQLPTQLDALDPVHAVVLAVRDDVADTRQRFLTADQRARARLAYEKFQKRLAEIPGLPKISLEIPWYVWLGLAGLGILFVTGRK